MSQFNQTSPETPNNSGKKNNSIIYWVIILVLIVACIFLFMSKNKMAEDKDASIKQEQQQIDSVKTDRAALQNDFDAASAKIDQLVSQNSKLDSALQGDKAAMAEMQSKIKTILSNKNATQAELKNARMMISSLTDKTKQMEARIAELEQQNTVLTGQNKTLTTERDSTVTQNIALKKAGSVLHASNIRMEPLHKRKNGKEKETTKHKKVNDIRITFDIDENRIAESGNKEIYLRILGPDNNTMGKPAGTLTTNTGGQVGYSVMKEIMLTQNQPVKDIVIDWAQDGEDYKKGVYTIEVYHEGYKVGSGNVTLR